MQIFFSVDLLLAEEEESALKSVLRSILPRFFPDKEEVEEEVCSYDPKPLSEYIRELSFDGYDLDAAWRPQLAMFETVKKILLW